MKKIILSMSMLLTLGAGTLFAMQDPGPGAEETFRREFAGAEFVKWEVEGDYHRASFVLGGHRAEAYFTKEGELLGSIRDLFYDQLPLAVMKAVDSRFPDADINGLREVGTSDGVTYKMTIEFKNKKYDLTVDSAGNLVEKTKVK
jgi:hypothetical protein